MAYARWDDLHEFPAHVPPFNFLYAVELSNGVVKVGRSCIPRGRFVRLINEWRVRGVRVLRIHVQPGTGESEVLARLRRIACCLGTTREYFTGLAFGQAVTILRQIAARELVTASPYVQGKHCSMSSRCGPRLRKST